MWLLLAVERDAAAAVVAMSVDESLLIVRGTHVELFDGETSVVSQFIVVDVVSGHLVGTVGPPFRGVTPAVAEFIANSHTLLVTCDVSSGRLTAGNTTNRTNQIT